MIDTEFSRIKDGKWIEVPEIKKIAEQLVERYQYQSEQYNILREDGVEIDLFEKPQQYAHHLNSSQIVCYEFFRPMLNADRTAKEILKRFITERSISAHKGVLMGRFEYLPDPDEYTNFDFYLEGNDVKIYFEIKYTENGFGKCDKDQKHKDKFETIWC